MAVIDFLVKTTLENISTLEVICIKQCPIINDKRYPDPTNQEKKAPMDDM